MPNAQFRKLGELLLTAPYPGREQDIDDVFWGRSSRSIIGDQEPRRLTRKQTWERLGISETALWRLGVTGKLVPLQDSRHKKYPVEWVERFESGKAPHPDMVALWKRMNEVGAKKRPKR